MQKGFNFQLNLINTSRYAADAHLFGMEGLHVGNNIGLILTLIQVGSFWAGQIVAVLILHGHKND